MNCVKNDLLFSSVPKFSYNKNDNTKYLNINTPAQKITIPYISRSWNEPSRMTSKHLSISPPIENNYKEYRSDDEVICFQNDFDDLNEYNDFNTTKIIKAKKYANNIVCNEFKPYDAINNCKSAGIIPFSIVKGEPIFLLQKLINPLRKKDGGWNDFGGKRIDNSESTAETAGREFSEETSCLFYLKQKSINDGNELNGIYGLLKNNIDLYYNEKTITTLKKLIIEAQQYYFDCINQYASPLYISSKETYISYLIKVDYIPENDLPAAEDIHVNYEEKYLRVCKWFTIKELTEMNVKDFHKRLQITRIQQRLQNYNSKGLFH